MSVLAVKLEPITPAPELEKETTSPLELARAEVAGPRTEDQAWSISSVALEFLARLQGERILESSSVVERLTYATEAEAAEAGEYKGGRRTVLENEPTPGTLTSPYETLTETVAHALSGKELILTRSLTRGVAVLPALVQAELDLDLREGTRFARSAQRTVPTTAGFEGHGLLRVRESWDLASPIVIAAGDTITLTASIGAYLRGNLRTSEVSGRVLLARDYVGVK